MEHKVEEVKLKCGAKGLLIDVPGTPVFVMEIFFRGGDAYTENKKKRETAHIMEHLAFGASGEFKSSGDVSRYICKNGASFNAHTSRKFLSYEIYSPDFDWKRLLKQLVSQVAKPHFNEKEFRAEFGNVQEEMKGRANDRWGELTCLMEQKFGWDSYETDSERLELMNNVGLEDIKKHYAKTHYVNNAVFFIAGDFSDKKDEVLEILEGLGELEAGKKLGLPKDPALDGYPDEPVVVTKEDVKNVYFAMESYANFGDQQKERVSSNLQVLNTVLTHGMHSRIFGKARERGLIYSLGCDRSCRESGLYSWEIYAQVGVDNIDEVMDLIVGELRDIKNNSLSGEEVEEAKLAIKGSLRMNNQTAGQVLGFYQGYYNSREKEKVIYFSEVDGWYNAITPESIQEFFINLIKTKKWGAGFLGNVTEAQAKKWNKKLAEIFED